MGDFKWREPQMTQMSWSGLSAFRIYKVTLVSAIDEWIRGHWRVFLANIVDSFRPSSIRKCLPCSHVLPLDLHSVAKQLNFIVLSCFWLWLTHEYVLNHWLLWVDIIANTSYLFIYIKYINYIIYYIYLIKHILWE